jgi:hypothetical protein
MQKQPQALLNGIPTMMRRRTRLQQKFVHCDAGSAVPSGLT